MSDRIAEVVILAEDLRQFNLASRYVLRANLVASRRNIRRNTSPTGRGAGEQYVREQYPNEVRGYRQRAARRKAALVVVIDADLATVQERMRHLSASLTEHGVPAREDHEAIGLLIPKRFVEIWIVCLTGQIVDEEDKRVKHQPDIDQKIAPAAITLFEWTRPNALLPTHCVDSLRRAIPELKRVEP